MLRRFFSLLLSLLPFCVASTVLTGSSSGTSTEFTGTPRATSTELYRFPNGTSINNLYVLPNESVLLTLFTEPSLYRLDYKSSEPVLVHRFPGYTSLFGVTQLNSTTVAVIAGNVTFGVKSIFGQGRSGVPGSFAVFLLSLSGRVLASFSIPNAGILLALAVPSPSSPYLLVADPYPAVVWRLNTLTGAVDLAIPNPVYPKSDWVLQLEGLKVVGNYLYFSDGFTNGRVRITPEGKPAGDVPETVDYDLRNYSGFGPAVAPSGDIYVLDVILNRLTRIYADGVRVASVDLDEGILDHPMNLAFSNTYSNILYIVTAGWLEGTYNGRWESDIPLGGNGGGQVVRVELNKEDL